MITSSIDLRKNVYDKNQYNKIFDTSFKEFGVLDNDSNEIPEVSVNTFFNLYDQLFYDIPAMGENNSHEYLVKTSGEYISQEFLAEEIQVLREEIAALRTENLQLETQLAQALGNEVDVQIPDIEIPDELVDSNIPTPENPSVAIPSSTPSNLINTSGLKGKAKRIANAFNLTITSNGKKGQNRLRRRLERSGYSNIQEFRQKLGV